MTEEHPDEFMDRLIDDPEPHEEILEALHRAQVALSGDVHPVTAYKHIDRAIRITHDEWSDD